MSRTGLLVAFAAGVAASPWLAVGPWTVFASVLLAAGAWLSRRTLWVLAVCAAVLGLGWGSLRLTAPRPEPLQEAVRSSGGAAFAWCRGRVLHAEPWRDGCRSLLRLSAYREDDVWKPCDTKVQAYLPVPPPVEGATVEASLRLALPASRTNPGQFDSAAYLGRQGVALTASSRSPDLLRIDAAPPWRLIARYRRAVESRLARDTGEDRGVILALLLGERGLVDPRIQDLLSASGLFHLVALSGLHVGLLLLLAAAAAHAANVHPRTRDIALLALLLAYGLLVASRPSLSRALLMAVLFLLVRLAARPQSARVAWAAALAVLLAVDPLWVIDPGFQLTFAATLGILLFWDAYPSWLPAGGWAGGLLRLFWVGLSAQLATLPFLALTFHRISLLGWLATPLASLPLMGIQALGIPYLFGLGFVPGLHDALGKGLELLAAAFLWLPAALGRGRLGCAFLPQPWLGWIALYAVGIALAAWKGRFRGAGWVVACLALVAAWAAPAPGPARGTRLTVLDVGQASCQVVESCGLAYLVDAGNGAFEGPSSARTVIEPFLAQAGIRGLSGIILTHWDADHAGSAGDLLADLRVGFLAYPEADPPRDARAAALVRLARRKGAHVLTLRAGDRFTAGDLPAAVWHPPANASFSEPNDLSLVLRVDFPTAPLLFTGDLQRAGERSLVAAGLATPVYGLLAPHHGSATSSGPGWVAAVAPRLTIFSVGRANRFGHPAPEVTARYAEAGARLLRTDRDGAIELVWRGSRPLAFRMRDGDLP